LYQFTARNAPDETDYAAHVVDLNSKCLTIDDNLSTQNPNPVKAGSVYPIDTASTLRGGSEVTTLIGPLYVNTGFGPYYRVQPESTADLVINQATNLRAATPPSGRVGELRIASSNLLVRACPMPIDPVAVAAWMKYEVRGSPWLAVSHVPCKSPLVCTQSHSRCIFQHDRRVLWDSKSVQPTCTHAHRRLPCPLAELLLIGRHWLSVPGRQL